MQVNKSPKYDNQQSQPHTKHIHHTNTVTCRYCEQRPCMAEAMVFQAIRGCKQTGRSKALDMVTDIAEVLAGNLAVIKLLIPSCYMITDN